MTIEEAKSKVLSLARGEIGYHESGENQTKYATQYDFDTRLYRFDMCGQPWCDYFFDWLFMKAFGFEVGSSMTYQYSGCCGAACAQSAGYYQQHNAFYSIPEVGDQIFFYVSGGINHTGIVEEICEGIVTTIEGNSSDRVKRNQYRLGDQSIAGYGRPAWRYAENIPTGSDGKDESVFSDADIIPIPDKKLSENTLKFGSTGFLVTALQATLNYYGADLDMDGEFGKLTREAVIEYQRTHNDADGEPLEADGIVGPKTWTSF